MRVKCLSGYLKEGDREKIGLPLGVSVEHAITPGNEYVVLGFSIEPKGAINGSGSFVYVVNDWGQCRSISMQLFDLVDARCSRYWYARNYDDGAVSLWPEEFYADYFLDDLIEGDAKANETFAKLMLRMNQEDNLDAYR